ncbi:unnamed protein product [Moneuplotes crassus]|uniref:CCT domain-containing protein n=1 Tax=Euplotes crassus TaxID=5936 RepID=A0AAD1UBH8_EUPCR|nr:unnamed protein product [Moneuplotes crassus]
MIGPVSNISQSDKPENTPWNDHANENRYNLFSHFPDSKSQSHVNQEDMNYQAAITQNNIPINPSISSIEQRGSAKNSFYECDEPSLFLKKAILDSSVAVMDEQAKYELPIPSSKENSVIFNINHPKMRDPVNDTHTDQSEKCRLEYLESNESSFMIRGGVGIPFIGKPPYSKSNKIPKERPIDLESNCSQSLIIKPPNRGHDRLQSSSIERFNRRSTSRDRVNRQSSSIERFNRQSSSIDRFQRILYPKSKEVPRSFEQNTKKQKNFHAQAMGKLNELVCKNEEEKEPPLKNFNLLSERSRQSSICKPPDLGSDSDAKEPRIGQPNIEIWENPEMIKVKQLEPEKSIKYFDINKEKAPKKKREEKLEVDKDSRSVHSMPINYVSLANSFEDRARTFNTKDPIRLAKIKKYLEKKKRRNFNRDIIYPTRKRVALMRPRVNGMFLPGKDLLQTELNKKKAKKPRIKKRPGRKRKYDTITKYSDLEDDIEKGKKIFKISKHK